MEKEKVINIEYMNAGAERMMLIDSGAPKSIVSSIWLEGYLKDTKVSDKDVKRAVVLGDLDWGKLYI